MQTVLADVPLHAAPTDHGDGQVNISNSIDSRLVPTMGGKILKRILWLALPALILLAACGGPAASAPADTAEGLPAVTVYKAPT